MFIKLTEEKRDLLLLKTQPQNGCSFCHAKVHLGVFTAI